MKAKRGLALWRLAHYLFLTALGLVLIFPLVYIFFATFKTSNEIFLPWIFCRINSPWTDISTAGRA